MATLLHPANLDRAPAERRPRIGFDVPPSSSGPGRYVRSLTSGLSPEEWEVVITEQAAEQAAEPSQPPALPSPLSATTPLRRRVLAAVPQPLKIWAGFGRQALAYSRRVAQERLDFVHVQNTGCEQAPVAARVAGVPLVLGTFHVNSAIDVNRLRSGPTHRALEWISCHSLHRAIAVCEATRRDWIERTGLAADRIVTIYNGIDPDKFRPGRSRVAARARLGLPVEAIVLGGLGRLDPIKGFADLIDALACLRSEFPQALVALGGTGPAHADLAARAELAGVSDRVALLGFQSDVNVLLDACDVFVVSSLSEALPFALLEAMAHELPCVGTTVGGIPEVIVAGQTGLLCPPRDSEALAAAIRPLLASAELRRRMGVAGRERVIRHFHEADMVSKTIQVYRELLAGRKGANA
jgi:glycosyltransferase involved in cell wall biosynthesis